MAPIIPVTPAQPPAGSAELPPTARGYAPPWAAGPPATQRVMLFEPPRRGANPAATTSLVTGLLSILLNPAIVLSIVASIAGGIGLRRRTAPRRSQWGIGLGIVGAIVGGTLTVSAILHPVVFKIQWWNTSAAATELRASAPGAAAYGDLDLARFGFELCELSDRSVSFMHEVEAAYLSGAGASNQLVARAQTYANDSLAFAGRWAPLFLGGVSPTDIVEATDSYGTGLAIGQQVATAIYARLCPGIGAEIQSLQTPSLLQQ